MNPEPPRGRRVRGRDLAPTPRPDTTMRRLVLGAIALALIAVALTVWRGFLAPASACQATAWGAAPTSDKLPTGWTTSATQFDPDRLSLTLVGPLPASQTANRAVIYATVSCFAGDAADAVTRSQAAAAAAGQTVSARSDLGDQGFTALTPSGSSFIQFRRGNVVVALAASGDTSAADVEVVAAAFDRTLGGDGVAAGPSASPASTTLPTGAASAIPTATGSPAPSAAAAAPELEALMPQTAGGVPLTINSAVGSDVLSTDPGSRAIIAALGAEGIAVDDFHAAEAYDASGSIDLSIVAFRAVGMDGPKLQQIVLETWLAANGTGVTTKVITLGGRSVTQVDYGDAGSTPYLAVSGDVVVVIDTKDASLAAEVAASIP